MTPHGLTALRRAALLCHTLPAVSAVLRAAPDGHERALVEVGGGGELEARYHLRPCQFRTAVAQAWGHMRDGGRICFLGLPEGVDPTIEIGVTGASVHHPGGIVEVVLADRTCIAVATTLSCTEARNALMTMASGHPSGCGHDHDEAIDDEAHVRVDFHHDIELGGTLVWTELVGEQRRGAVHDQTLDTMRDVLARCATAELDGDLVALAGRHAAH